MINTKLPKIVDFPPGTPSRYGEGRFVVPSPAEVEEYMRAIPEGRVATLSQMRAFLADKHSADMTCPMTAGLFVRIAAEAAEEDARAGKTPITPYWRMVKDDGSLNPKLPGGVASQARKLRAEGHTIITGKGKQPPLVVLHEPGRGAKKDSRVEIFFMA